MCRLMFDTLPTALSYIKAASFARWRRSREAIRGAAGRSADDRLRAGLRRQRLFGIGVPKGTPVEIVERLSKETNAILADPGINAQFADIGAPLRSRLLSMAS